MPGYSVRRATVRDLDVLVRHRRGMFEDMGGHDPERLDLHDRSYRRWARQRLRTKRFLAWVAVTSGGDAVASGAVWLQDVQPNPRIGLGPVPYLLSMYTVREHRGKGLASRIVREAMRWAKREGYPRMTLHASDMGRGVYLRLGWERTWEMRARLGAARRRPPGRRFHLQTDGRSRSRR